MKGVLPCGCGQCNPCRFNKRRMWANRLMLEKMSHSDAAFVTLTYRDEEVKDYSGESWSAIRPVLGTLAHADPQKFLKRLRRRGFNIRYFLVGEYGTQTQRPHYHLALYGFPSCFHGRTQMARKICCPVCQVVKDTWKLGNVNLGELNQDSAQYLAKYVTKKWTTEDEWTKQKLKGRKPEYARMSLKPGIGALAIKQMVTSTVQSPRLEKILINSLDAPAVLRTSGSILPLGKYLRRKWREALGRSSDTPKSELERYCSEMQKLHEENKAKAQQEGSPFLDAKTLFSRSIETKIKSLENKINIYQTRSSL